MDRPRVKRPFPDITRRRRRPYVCAACLCRYVRRKIPSAAPRAIENVCARRLVFKKHAPRPKTFVISQAKLRPINCVCVVGLVLTLNYDKTDRAFVCVHFVCVFVRHGQGRERERGNAAGFSVCSEEQAGWMPPLSPGRLLSTRGAKIEIACVRALQRAPATWA